MEYLSGGSVEDEAQGAPLPLSRAKRLMVDVLRGLGHAHSRGIVHRDITKSLQSPFGIYNQTLLSEPRSRRGPSGKDRLLGPVKKPNGVLEATTP
jgi:serine/threonine protein kinase